MVEFKVEKKENPNVNKYHRHNVDLAYVFAKRAYNEFDTFLKAIVLFGSTMKDKGSNEGDIDILLIVDDVSINLSAEIVETYRVIVERLIADTSRKLHVTTLKFTTFWEYIKAGDPIGINILRDGVPLIDSGFFEPLQRLLFTGRIRPTYESIWAYFSRAPRTLYNSKWHMMQATIDLYWAVIDSAHAAIMKMGEIPPRPEDVAAMLNEKLVKKKLLDKKYVHTMEFFYEIFKKIIHREIREIRATDYERYYKAAEAFVKEMERILGKK